MRTAVASSATATASISPTADRPARAEKSPSHPNVPTIGETVPGYRVESWYGIYAPAGTPQDVIAKLNGVIAKVAKTGEFRKRLEPEGIVISVGRVRPWRGSAVAEDRQGKQHQAGLNDTE